MREFAIDNNITLEDIDYIEDWLKIAQQKEYDDFYGNIRIIKNSFENGDFLLYRSKDKKAEGFIIFNENQRVVLVDLICINPSFRKQGVGKRFVADCVNCFKKRKILVVVAEAVTFEGAWLCKSTGFQKDCGGELGFYRKYLEECREQDWSANRRFVLWKTHPYLKTQIPDASWNLDFDNDKTPILDYAYREWYYGIIENDEVVKHCRVNSDYNTNNGLYINNSYMYIDNDVFKKIESHPLQPFLPKNARILMLGSFPPKKEKWSMEFFYPNWINDMWRIWGLIFYNDKHHFEIKGEKRFDKDKIVSFCKDEGFALYDTASEVVRLKDNASDKFLEVVKYTDVKALLESLPECENIVTTGQKATDIIIDIFQCEEPKVGEKTEIIYKDRTINFWRMPSSSRAYPMKVEVKAECYRKIYTIIKMK